MNDKKIIAGIDEAGRGPLAGPVVAAAVILPVIIDGVNDSKKLSRKRRENLYDLIIKYGVVGVGVSSVEEIDKINILAATMLAMQRAYDNLKTNADIVLVDGNKEPKLSCKDVRAIIGGDAIEPVISAASIIAKVTRDRMMQELDKEFPQYLWKQNVGYGTKDHLSGIKEFGITRHHRLTFAPIKDLIGTL